MDKITQDLINNFVDFLNRNLHDTKHLQHIQFGKWSLKDNKVTLNFIFKDEHKKIFVDLREIKDNEFRFTHLLSYIIDSLNNELKTEAK